MRKLVWISARSNAEKLIIKNAYHPRRNESQIPQFLQRKEHGNSLLQIEDDKEKE